MLMPCWGDTIRVWEGHRYEDLHVVHRCPSGRIDTVSQKSGVRESWPIGYWLDMLNNTHDPASGVRYHTMAELMSN